MNPFPPPDDLPSLASLTAGAVVTPANRAAGYLERLRIGIATHPRPALAWIETVWWVVVLLSVVDHLLWPNGTVGQLVWWLTIGPHEIGHLICMPFGTLLMFLGGTIWQLLFWGLIGLYEARMRRRFRVLLLCLALVGHSFINAAVYISDAQARSLPLLFGMDSSHHDWWNIFSMLGLLPFDWVFGALARLTGALLVAGVVLVAVYRAWTGERFTNNAATNRML